MCTWIKTSERLPVDAGTVRVVLATRDGQRFIADGWYIADGDVWEVNNDHWSSKRVTHWAEGPELPPVETDDTHYHDYHLKSIASNECGQQLEVRQCATCGKVIQTELNAP